MAQPKQKRALEKPTKPRSPAGRKKRIALIHVPASGAWVEPLPKR